MEFNSFNTVTILIKTLVRFDSKERVESMKEVTIMLMRKWMRSESIFSFYGEENGGFKRHVRSSTSAHYGTKPGHFRHQKFTFPLARE